MFPLNFIKGYAMMAPPFGSQATLHYVCIPPPTPMKLDVIQAHWAASSVLLETKYYLVATRQRKSCFRQIHQIERLLVGIEDEDALQNICSFAQQSRPVRLWVFSCYVNNRRVVLSSNP